MAELEIDRLSLRFGGLTVLDRVSLAVEKGELFAMSARIWRDSSCASSISSG